VFDLVFVEVEKSGIEVFFLWEGRIVRCPDPGSGLPAVKTVVGGRMVASAEPIVGTVSDAGASDVGEFPRAFSDDSSV
jgi:hypothetical protein